MKTEDKLRAAIRGYTESITPSPSAWNRIDAAMGEQRQDKSRFVIAAAVVAALGGLIALRIVVDDRPSRIELINPPVVETPNPSPESSPKPVSTVEGRWVRTPSLPSTGAGWGSSVWTGNDFIVWTELYQRQGIGFAYTPETRKWRTIARTEIGGVAGGAAVWTGSEMIVWGAEAGIDEPPSRQGAAYDPSEDRWRRIAQAPLKRKYDHRAVWTGKENDRVGTGRTPGPVRRCAGGQHCQ